MSSLTLTISGDSSHLHSQYFPPIDLSDGQYVCGLVNLQTFNSIPNVNESNNKITAFRPEQTNENQISLSTYEVIIPTGAYEIQDLAKYISERFKKQNIKFELVVNPNTLKCEVYCSLHIGFTLSNSIGSLLGFSKKKLEPNKWHESDRLADILKVHMIRVDCNIVEGSFINGTSAHIIHEFSPQVPPGYKISEVPNNVIYYPITVKSISSLDVTLNDQNNKLIDFRGEFITIRLHIKKI